MPKAFFDRDPVTLQEGNHILAQIGGNTLEPDETKSISGEVERVIIYHSPDLTTELRCTHEVHFSPGEKVIFQQLDPVTYAAIGMESGQEVEFKE
ncbi:hypothetical protein N7492_001822 [Penicillium capsulatum]|uniref:Uncharacterized protein n=1 Tax=Penicillium capsulatum TaxID=69766 RepID=A0A9W9IVE8_9EURO|nr:hypothetical protein N7492_001822 [Penicillium capsulatum]KAJ6129129.1 hypothetical protein N7512_001909 [Penicillium capsulatum]